MNELDPPVKSEKLKLLSQWMKYNRACRADPGFAGLLKSSLVNYEGVCRTPGLLNI